MGFLISSGIVSGLFERALDWVTPRIEARLYAHLNVFTIYSKARYFFILPGNLHVKSLAYGMPVGIFLDVATNAAVNAFFQPLFLCVFTPQTILSYILFPFFLYGSVKYFRKVPLMIIFGIFCFFYIGLRQPVAEALIRHRLTCELIYFSVGLAGLSYLMQRR